MVWILNLRTHAQAGKGATKPRCRRYRRPYFVGSMSPFDRNRTRPSLLRTGPTLSFQKSSDFAVFL
jgi:hypothetical protein